MKKYDIAIIGAGASGLAAAISASRAAAATGQKLNIALLEALPRVGKKILSTGNGRCNLGNTDTDISHYRGDTSFVQAVLSGGDCDTEEFFRSLGLLIKSDGGRLYPLSGQASGVLDALRLEVARLGCEVVTDTKITSITHTDCYTLNNSIKSKDVILCTGGIAALRGTDNAGYGLLEQLGLKITPLYPSLVQLIASQGNFKALKGIRADGEIRIMLGKKCLGSDSGELQFTDCGISGIPAMQVSRAVSANVQKGNISARLDLCERLSQEQLRDFFLKRAHDAPQSCCEDVMTGIMPKRLGLVLLLAAGIRPDAPAENIIPKLDKLVCTIKEWEIPLAGTKGFPDAQVTSGGAQASQFNPETLEAKAHKGFFCAGEALDVDGECGGYNLHWAWCSGRRAGRYAAEYMIGDNR